MGFEHKYIQGVPKQGYPLKSSARICLPFGAKPLSARRFSLFSVETCILPSFPHKSYRRKYEPMWALLFIIMLINNGRKQQVCTTVTKVIFTVLVFNTKYKNVLAHILPPPTQNNVAG